ncbi:hypothetical protein V2J09_020529 [Rumex salicifolius]
MRRFNHHFLFLSLLILAVASAIADDLKSDRAALVALRSALRGRSLLWNDTTPLCSWQGIVCNKSRVTEIHMPGRSLFGTIPDGVLGNLTGLNFLSLRFNALNGTLPPDFPSLKKLQYLYVQGNYLSGDIPAVLFSIPGLVRINLAGNKFSGQIPSSFNNFTQLSTLYLEDNQLSGQIPELNLPSLKQFNVSNNLLNGTIPRKLTVFPANSFEGNSLCGPPLLSCSNSNGTAGSGGKKKHKLSGGAIAGIIIAAVLLAVFLLLCLICLCCRRKKDDGHKSREVNAAPGKDMDMEMAGAAAAAAAAEKHTEENVVATGSKPPPASASAVKGTGVNKTLVFFGNAPRVFDLDDLLRASAEVLGKGTYGTTYKAALDSGVAVAVKRLKDVVVTEEEFKAKMEEIGRLDHENLVALKAYHANGNERLLVYDYLPLGSLSALLHGNKGSGRTPLNWETRSMIALGTARGVQYIHSQGSSVSHGDIKSSNVLLSNNYEARVSDFGLGQVVSTGGAPNRVAGYRAPEVTDPRKVSQKADVYSFGVFILELLTGKAPIVNEEGVDLPRWVQSVVREEWSSEVFDVELLRYQNVEEEMVELLQLAVDCTAQYPDNRPSMADVTARIEQICRSTSAKTQEPDPEEINISADFEVYIGSERIELGV